MENMPKLRKKSFTIVERACHEVRGFRSLLQDLDDKVRLSGHSLSTLKSYSRKLAALSLHFGKLPQNISDKEVNKYLAQLARQNKTPSLSDFKFTVFGLRYCYRLLGMADKVVVLPQIKHTNKLPVVLNHQECRAIFEAPDLLKHRVLLSLMYSAGLRAGEVSRLKLSVIGHKNLRRQVSVSQNKKVLLFPVKNISRVFRGKFIAGLQKQFVIDSRFMKELRKTDWVVYVKEPFAGPEQVVEYLGRYSHKVAISNHRILNINDQGVTFRWRDYRDDKQKVMTLSGAEFLRRFSMHILPKRFVRIRHYGILSATNRPLLRELQHAFGLEPVLHREIKHWKEVCRENLGFDPDLCPECGEGLMVVIQYLDPSRAPPETSVLSLNSFPKTTLS